MGDQLELHHITIRLMADPDGGMTVDVETDGDLTEILAFGMLAMAEANIWDQLGDDDE